MASLATRSPKRLVMPWSSSSAVSVTAGVPGGGRCPPPGGASLDCVRRDDHAVLDLALDHLHLGPHVRGHLRVDQAEAGAVVGGVERRHAAALEAAVHDL